MNEEQWFADYANVLALANWLDDDGYFETPNAVIYFFSKPWKYEEEWKARQDGYENFTVYEEAKEDASL